ncbi:hypothetical protein GCM10007928_52460 [Sulfitobacter porphyrae]|nr:hypothetical protein GCM10007928_52460 [Sulfitobacter porphyrae]
MKESKAIDLPSILVAIAQQLVIISLEHLESNHEEELMRYILHHELKIWLKCDWSNCLNNIWNKDNLLDLSN